MSQKKIKRNKDEKIKKIFETFVNLINKIGYDKITTRQIAREARISIGTIYRYFPQGKPLILGAFLKQEKEEIFNFSSILKDNEKPLPGFIKSYVSSHVQSHRKYFEIHKAFDQALLANRELFENIEMTLNEIFDDVTNKIKNLKISKLIPEEWLIENLKMIYNLMDGIIHRHLFIMPLFEKDEELIEFLSKLILFIIENRI